jgi:hypothetical protein
LAVLICCFAWSKSLAAMGTAKYVIFHSQFITRL